MQFKNPTSIIKVAKQFIKNSRPLPIDKNIENVIKDSIDQQEQEIDKKDDIKNG